MGNSTDIWTSFWNAGLTTHRDHDLGADESSYFQYECFLAAISVFFCRMTVKSDSQELFALRFFFSLALAFLAYSKKPYEMICAIQMFSYAVPIMLTFRYDRITSYVGKFAPEKATRLLLIALSAALSLVFCRSVSSGLVFQVLVRMTPKAVQDAVFALFPIEEVHQAYKIVAAFSHPEILQSMLSQLLFVTFNIQVAMGHLGIGFLYKEQVRRNELIRMELVEQDAEEEEENEDPKSATNGGSCKENGKENAEDSEKKTKKQLKNARRFQKGAVPFIFFTAIPYMIQIIAFGNMNMFAYTCVLNDMHRAVRLNELFDDDAHLVAMAVDSPTAPSAYAASMDTVVSTVYDMFNRKFFSLPKFLLLPGIIMRHPMLVAKLSPLIFGSDLLKGRLVGWMTATTERLQKESKEIEAIRSKVEAFDMKNAELLQRSGTGATKFTQRRWEELTVAIQEKDIASQLLVRTKVFFAYLQRSFIFGVFIDCALAQLIALGKIVSAEIWVFSRAVEDSVDLVLMRSRAEAELARMLTEIEKLQELADVWEKSKERSLLPCRVSTPDMASRGIVLRHLQYTRGTAMVKAEHVELPPGIYAVTGGNGSGKSTLFRVLMSCSTNEKAIDLPESIYLMTPEELPIKEDALSEGSCKVPDDSSELDAEIKEDVIPKLSITMPSSDIVEISQNFYWPLYTKPIDWIYQCHLEDKNEKERISMVRRVAEELVALEFMQAIQPTVGEEKFNENRTKSPSLPLTDDILPNIMAQLQEEKEDWFGDLSGGQKSKVELVRKVFLRKDCPNVVLIDETMAPLDPTSKSLVMSKIKNFCKGSVVLVIYHTDVGVGKAAAEEEEEDIVECVPSNNFFDDNIHVVNHRLTKRPLC